jgi:hypothetical protein
MILLLVTAVFVILAVVYAKHARQLELSGRIKGPKGLPVLKNCGNI